MAKEDETLVAIYSGFLDERNKFLGSRWRRLLGYFLRMWGMQNGFILLLSSENKFHTDMYGWIKGHIKVNKLTYEQVENTLFSLKLFKEELNGRNLFLVLFAVLLGLSAVLYNFFDQYLGKATDPALFAANIIFGFMAILERGNVITHMTSSSQLQLFLDKWLDSERES